MSSILGAGASVIFATTCCSAVICIPLLVSVIGVWQPLKTNGDATALTGIHRGWRLTHVTGKVLASQRHTETYGGGNVYGSATSGTVTGSAHVTTEVHDTLNLKLADGSETDVEVVNFNVSARPGSVVSIWTAEKRSRWFTFAVLNHTTNQQTVNQVQVMQIMQPFQTVWVLYLAMATIPIVIIGVFGVGVPCALFFGLLLLYVWGQKKVRSAFNSSGLYAIWDRSRTEARLLPAP